MMQDDEKCGKKHVNCELVLIMMTNESKNQGGPVPKRGEKWDHVQWSTMFGVSRILNDPDFPGCIPGNQTWRAGKATCIANSPFMWKTFQLAIFEYPII
jgi:hypothetical protein